MAITQHGEGVFGIPANETGFITHSLSYNYGADKTELPDFRGDTTGVAYYNEKVEGTISGKIPVSSAFATLIAAELTLINQPDDYLQSAVSGSAVLVDTVGITKNMGEYNDIDVAFTMYPFVSLA